MRDEGKTSPKGRASDSDSNSDSDSKDDIMEDERVRGTKSATTGDYVQLSEFRLANAYLIVYAGMLDAFSVVEGGDGGADSTTTGDRRISYGEWTAGFSRVKDYGFKALMTSDPGNEFF